MALHQNVLEAALRICRERGGWTFRPKAVVTALPDLNPASVRTHIMSRCCVNAPAHHAHRWPYFRRVRRGVYEVLPALRRRPARRDPGRGAPGQKGRSEADPGTVVEVRETASGFLAVIPGRTGHVRGSSLDELAERVRDAALRTREGGTRSPGPLRLQVALETERADPVTEAYERDIDRSLIRQSLRMSCEERLLALESWMNATEDLRGAARRRRRRASR